jgi:hypothetical protein
MRKILYGTLAVAVVVGGCTIASHLRALQSQRIPAPVPLTIPENVAIRPPAFQRGIDVDAYTYPGQDFSAAAAQVVAYVKSLAANSLAISFPLFMSGRRSSKVFATAKTPTPAELGLFIADAERAGLYVSLRPLLSETHIGGNRTIWLPAHPSAWFANYLRFLLPYARMAQATKVGTFFVGAEFSKFGDSRLWDGLDGALAKVFHGRLAYSENNGMYMARSDGGRSTVKTVDAYPPMNPPLRSGWEAFDRQLPAGTILSELGISAFDGAWRKPWVHRAQNRRLDPRVQARWFSAACQAAKATRLRGIYFWSIPLTAPFPRTTKGTPGAWAYGVGARAIARCFGHAQ